MNIKISSKSYRSAIIYFQNHVENDEANKSWIVPLHAQISDLGWQEYDVFEYVGGKYPRVDLFISKKDNNGHVVSISPPEGIGCLSASEHDAIINCLMDIFDSNNVEYEML